ncbi:MAG: hypothetical protein ABJO09_08395 [Hyphomicrobiales bacterium]
MASFFSKLAFTIAMVMLFACTGIFCFSVSHANAETPSEIAAEAEELARQGDMPEALEKMQQAADALWDLQNFKLLKSGFEVDGTLQNSLVVKSGEAFTAVAAFAGFGYRNEGDKLSVSFEVDLNILHQSGRILASRENFAVVSEAVSNRIAEFTLKMKVQTPALLDGEYQAVFKVRDLASEQSRDFILPFSVSGILE